MLQPSEAADATILLIDTTVTALFFRDHIGVKNLTLSLEGCPREHALFVVAVVRARRWTLFETTERRSCCRDSFLCGPGHSSFLSKSFQSIEE